MAAGQLFQHVLRGGGLAALGGLGGRQPQTFKQHLAYLLGRTDIELAPGRLVDAGGQSVQLGLDLVQKALKRIQIHAHARPLHGRPAPE